MYIKLCDRCGRVTKNTAYLLVKTTKVKGTLQIDGSWFDQSESITLCNNCLEDFEDWFDNYDRFNDIDNFDFEKDK